MITNRKRIVIIGGTSGIGFEVAKLAAVQGMEIVITGYKNHSDTEFKRWFPADTKIEIYQLDIANEQAVKEFFSKIGPFDYLTTPGSTLPKGPFLTMDSGTAKQGFDSKFWGQYFAAKYGVPSIREEGAIVFFSGVIGQRPQANLSIMASVNSAVEGLGRALAVELAPLRVNILSPGYVDTSRYAGMPADKRKELFDSLSEKLPVRHVGKPQELAEAALFLLTNTYTTGITLQVDGGYLLI